jgi:hypothetical protein
MGYVLAIAGNRRIDLEGKQVSAADAAARVADRHWHRYRADQAPKAHAGTPGPGHASTTTSPRGIGG